MPPLARPLTTRALTLDDGPASRRLGQEAFGVQPTPAPEPPASPPGQHPVGSFDGDRLVARVIGREYHSWFGGAQIPTWGIAGVTVEAEYRGHQALTELFAATFEQARSWGAALSTLYPTAPGIYRPFGYEIVGSYVTVEIPTSALARVRATDTVRTRRAETADHAAIQQVYQRWACAQNGPLTRTGPSFAGTADDFIDAYTGVTLAVDDTDQVLGFASWERGSGHDSTAKIEVGDLIASTPEATRALLRVLGSFATVTGYVRVDTSGFDLAVLELPGRPWRPVTHEDYMLRVLDPQLAIEGRRYPRLLQGSVSFRLADPTVSEISGGYHVDVADGVAQCTRVDDASGPELTSRGLALLYTGAQSLINLRHSGHAIGGDESADADLDALFAGRQLHIRNYF